jgi:peptidyl-prolyl cis-trans isomerase SurA
MRVTDYKTMQRWMRGTAALVVVCGLLHGARCLGQSGAAATDDGKGAVLDRVVAVVNDNVILESDVDEERRFEEIQPYRGAPEFSRDKIIERLVDRTLILQQAELEPEIAVTDAELDAQLTRLRNDIPVCKQYHCDTDAGWKQYLGDHGFTADEMAELWRKRMELLRFIEIRFRNGIHITDAEIKTYYEQTMLPEYAKRNVTAPKLDTLSKRVEEVLLQKRVGDLLEDWLKSLRAQGDVRMMTPGGEVAP